MLFQRKNKFSSEQLEQPIVEKESKKKKVKNLSVKPRGFIARKAGVVTFWTLFGFMFLVVFVNVLGDSSNANADQQMQIEADKAISQEAVQFAKDFAEVYFTWKNTPEGKGEREVNLKKYLASSVDKQVGINFSEMEWNSQHINSEVKNTESKSDNISNITLKVNYKLTKVDLETNKVTETKTSTKYFVVPVAYDGKTFGVYELPKFTYIQEETTVDSIIYGKLKHADNGAASEVKQFLSTFFKSYAEDSQEQFNYILVSDNVIAGLNNTMIFERVNGAEVYEVPTNNQGQNTKESNNEYIIYAEVTFSDPDTNISFNTNYQLTAVNVDGKYLVKAMDEQKGQSVKQKAFINTEEKNNESEESTGEAAEEKTQGSEIKESTEKQTDNQRTEENPENKNTENTNNSVDKNSENKKVEQ